MAHHNSQVERRWWAMPTLRCFNTMPSATDLLLRVNGIQAAFGIEFGLASPRADEARTNDPYRQANVSYMEITNIHERVLDGAAAQVGRLIDGLSSSNDPLWPVDRWPPMQFDRPLAVGASGGHGPIRYAVESYVPGESVRFRFTEPKGFLGTHRFEVEPTADGKSVLRHVIEMQVSGRSLCIWMAVIRPLHDALLEDALDRAETSLGKEMPQRVWSRWVKVVRWFLARRA
jgi:hypothetical protein